METPKSRDTGSRTQLCYHGAITPHRPYPSDLSDARWALIEPTLTAWRAARLQARAQAGITVPRPPTSLRDIFDAILYVNRIAWKYLPHDFPPHTTVYYYFSAWAKEGIFERLGIDLTSTARAKEGRKPEPSACVIDSQSVKTSTNVPLGTQGVDAGKKIVGRKRGILTDTLGLLDCHHPRRRRPVRQRHRQDPAHPGRHHLPDDHENVGGHRLQERRHRTRRFLGHRRRSRPAPLRPARLPRRQTPLGRRTHPGLAHAHRRLARDYETRTDHASAMIRIASIDNLTRRITGETTPTWRDA